MAQRFFMAAPLRKRGALSHVGARPPTPDDRVALSQLMLDAYRGTLDDEGETASDALAVVDRLFAGQFGAMMWSVSEVSERDGRMAAAVLITLSAGAPFVAFLLTHPDWQRQGLARDGLQRAMSRLAAGDETELRLVVTQGNPAEHLYQSLGFVPVPDPH